MVQISFPNIIIIITMKLLKRKKKKKCSNNEITLKVFIKNRLENNKSREKKIVQKTLKLLLKSYSLETNKMR